MKTVAKILIITSNSSNLPDRTEYYTTAKNLLVSGADAMERLMTAYKEIVELAGYTARVAIMIQVFEDCSESKYQRQVVAGAPSKGVSDSEFSLEFQNGMPISKGVVTESMDGTIHLENVSDHQIWKYMLSCI